SHVYALEKLFDGEASELRCELSAARKDSCDAGFLDARALLFQGVRQRFQQLGSGEQALDVVSGFENGERLINHMVLVSVQVLHPSFLDELYDPTGIEIDAKTNSASILAQMLYRQAKSSRTGRAKHEPVRAFREMLFGQRLTEHLVIDSE